MALAPTRAISAKLEQPLPWQRSIMKPSSLSELSAHVRFTRLEDAAVADRLFGAAGGGAPPPALQRTVMVPRPWLTPTRTGNETPATVPVGISTGDWPTLKVMGSA